MSDITRFIVKQEKIFEIAYNELKEGMKKSHWMWYIFPQIEGLGNSNISKMYAIKDKVEAIEYFENEYLRNNYLALCELLLELDINDPIKIFGYVDSLKLHSSLTLFHIVSKNNIIYNVLEKYFSLKLDEYTIKKLS